MADKLSPNYQMKLYDSEDNAGTFLNFRTSLAGSQTSSNFMIIDTEMARLSSNVEVLSKAPAVVYARASKSNSTNYIAAVEGLKEYVSNMLLVISLEESNTGATSLKINNLDSVYIKRYNSSGLLVDIKADELIHDKNYLLRYSGAYFILISPIVATDFRTEGTVGHILSVAEGNVITDSGISIGDIQNKIDKVAGATAGHIATLNADGTVADSNQSMQTFSSTLSAKADKVAGATNGHIATLNASGNLTDSGKSMTQINSDIASKADKVIGATAGNIAVLDSNGNIANGSKTVANVITEAANSVDLSSKADKVIGATVGHIATLNATGNLIDSGKTVNNFAPSTHVSDTTVHLSSSDRTNLSKIISSGDGTKFLTNNGSYQYPMTENRQKFTANGQYYLGGSPFIVNLVIEGYHVTVDIYTHYWYGDFVIFNLTVPPNLENKFKFGNNEFTKSCTVIYVRCVSDFTDSSGGSYEYLTLVLGRDLYESFPQWVGTQTEYNAISSKSASTLYFIKE